MSDPRTIARLEPEEREALGLDPDSPLTVIESDGDWNDIRSRSERYTSVTWSHRQLADWLKAERTTLVPVRLSKLERYLPEVRISRWCQDPQVALLSMERLGNTAFYGTCSWLDGKTLLLDARSRPAYAVGMTDEREWILRCLGGELTLFEGSPAKSIRHQWCQTAVAKGFSSLEQEPEPMTDILGYLQQRIQVERRVLGIQSKAFLRLVEYLAAPAELPPARSAPSGVALRDLDELLPLLRRQRESVQARFVSLSSRLPGAELEYWKDDSRIAFLTCHARIGKTHTLLSGLSRWLDEHVAMLDSRRRPVYVQGRYEGLEWVLRCENGALALFEGSADTSGTRMDGPDEQRNCSMNGLTPEELDVLGIARDTELEPVEHVIFPSGTEATPSGAQPELPRTRAGWDDLRVQDLESLPGQLQRLRSILQDGKLSRWRKDARVLFLEIGNTQTEIQLAGACSWIGHGTALIDVRERPAYVHGRFDDAVWVLRSCLTELTLFVEMKMSEEADWESDTPPEIPAPDIDSFVGQAVVQPWLLLLAKSMAGASRLFLRVAAAGVLARLWSSPNEASREQNKKCLNAGHLDPAAAALDWFKTLGAEGRELIEGAVLYEWKELESSFEELVQTALEDPDAFEESGRAWLHRRDDIESVLFLLRRVDAGTAAARGLAKFDQRVAGYRELWRWVDVRDDERLRAVSWQYPDDWWGGLVVDEKP